MTRQRHRTVDREATPILTIEQIGPKRSKTPEGYLLCEDVPLARVGTMFYGPNETPIKTRDGVARVTRTADTLFNDKTLASLNVKPITGDHPEVDVRPDNWKKHAVGITLNPRRGTGDNADVIVGDLLIMDAQTIRDVDAGKREVSLGYEAEYVQTGDGEGEQRNILCNHVALVDRGRCGPRCAIGDQQTISQEPPMGTKVHMHSDGAHRARKQLPQALKRLVLDALEDPSLMDETASMDTGVDNQPPGGPNDTHVHVHMHGGPNGPADIDPATPGDQPPTGDPSLDGAPGGADNGDPYEQRFQAIEGTLSQIMEMLQGGSANGEITPAPEAQDPGPGVDPGGDDPTNPAPPEDDKTKDGMKTMDSAAFQTSFTKLMSDAEVLVPGYRLPTFDAAAPRRLTLDSMCQQRRRIVDHLMATQPGRVLVESVAGSAFDTSKADCASVASVFTAAAGAKRLLNNASHTRDAASLPTSVTQPGAVGGVKSIADVNASNRQYWEARKKKV